MISNKYPKKKKKQKQKERKKKKHFNYTVIERGKKVCAGMVSN